MIWFGRAAVPVVGWGIVFVIVGMALIIGSRRTEQAKELDE